MLNWSLARGCRKPETRAVRMVLMVASLGLVAAVWNSLVQEAIAEELPCAPETRCVKALQKGQPDPQGDYLAQCAGRFPDYLVEATHFPKDYAGPWFALAQNFPKTKPSTTDLPWTKIDFRKNKKAADAYLYALRDYAFEGMIEADFRPRNNETRAWFHAPLMNFVHGRELVHGLTEERELPPGELGLRNWVKNFAIGFYNDIGGYTFGQVWKEPNAPDLSESQFEEGAMVFKILFSAARRQDFDDPDAYILQDAPEWRIATGDGELTTVRLLQMDVAVKDQRAGKTGWVFGTFAYQKDAEDPLAWNKLRPVGLMWGNDPRYTPEDQAAGKPFEEAFVSGQIPDFAKTHLGWAGRVNGPVDNPNSSCLSCHSTAQYPVAAPLLFNKQCTTIEQKLHWFRNLAGDEPFGAVDKDNCLPHPLLPPPVSLDFSLQMQVAAQALFDYGDVNTCTPAAPSAALLAAPSAGVPLAPRVAR